MGSFDRAGAALAISAILLAACGGSKYGGSSTPVRSPSPGVTAGASVPASGATALPSTDAEEQAAANALRDLQPLLLVGVDIPAGFRVRSNQPVTKGQVAASQIGIPKLAAFVTQSDLEGAWAALYTREDPNSGLSSIVYRFATPAGAAGFLDTARSITTADYPAAISVELVQADVVGERSSLVRNRVPGGRSLEYTWLQGRLVGQIILRYAGDVEGDDDRGLLVSLARKQSGKMAIYAQ